MHIFGQGDLKVRGKFLESATHRQNFRLIIIGGSGAYNGAAGKVKVHNLGPRTSLLRFDSCSSGLRYLFAVFAASRPRLEVGERAPRLGLGGLLVESARILTSGFVLFLVAGLLVFVPIGLIEGLGLNVANVDGLHGPSVAAVVAGAVLFGSASLLGEVLYSGMVTRGVADERRHERHRLGEVLRELPYLRLMAADLLFVVAVTAGLALLVAPGLILLVLFGVVAPVIEVERVGVIAAFRRSAELVRRDFWRAALLLVAVVVISETVDEALQAGVSDALGNTFAAEWVAATLAGVVTAPLFAVPVVVLYFGLAELLAAGAPPAAIAATSPGTVTNR